jgi:hypothetical protein
VALVVASAAVSLVTLGGCRHLDGLEQLVVIGMRWTLFVAIPIVVVRGSSPFPSGEPKGTLVGCSCH